MPVSILQACKVNVMDQDQNCSSRRCLGACFRSFRAHWYLLVVTLCRPRLRAWFRDRPDTVVETLTDSRVCNKPSFVTEINGCFLWLHSSASLKWHPEGISLKLVTTDVKSTTWDLCLFVLALCFFLYYLHVFTHSLPGQELYVPDLLLCSGLQIEFILMWWCLMQLLSYHEILIKKTNQT